MSKDEKLQARVESDVYDLVETLVDDREQSQAEFLREAVKKELEFIEEGAPNIRADMFADISALGYEPSQFESEPGPAVALADTWDELMTIRESVRVQFLEETGPIYIAGQGSSLAAGEWVAHSMRDDTATNAVHTIPAAEFSLEQLPTDSNLLLISRSGVTSSVVAAAEAARETEISTTALTDPESELADEVDQTIPLPDVTEHLPHYSKQNFILQIAILYTVFVADAPTESALQQSFEAIDAFLEDHLTMHSVAGPNSGDEQRLGLKSSSQFRQTAQMLLREEDIQLDPIVSAVGHYRGHCPEAVQKFTELLYRNAVAEHPGNIRDRLLNLMHAGEGYLLFIAPEADTSDYWGAVDHVFRNEQSIDNLLRYNRNPTGIPLITLTFNDVDRDQHHFERNCKQYSTYTDQQLLTLPQHDDQFTNDLILFVGLYLFVAALLEELWNIDKTVRKTIIRRRYPKAVKTDREIR